MSINIDKLKVGKENDRRYKLTDEQKEEIRHEYSHGQITQVALAKKYGVSRTLIRMVLSKEYYEKSKERTRKRKTRVNKKVHSERVQKYREHKRALLMDGKIKINNNDKVQ